MKTMVSLGRASVATTTVPLAVYPDSTSSILIGFCRENPYPAPCEQVYSVGGQTNHRNFLFHHLRYQHVHVCRSLIFLDRHETTSETNQLI